MQSLTYKFNASTTQLNPVWLSIFSLWIILDAEQSSNNKMCLRNKALQYNKTRQAMITTELMDIVNGTEALSKGGSD